MSIFTIARYEITRMLRLRSVLIIQFALPLLLIFILGAALSGTFQTGAVELKPVKATLVTADTGPLAEPLATFLADPDIARLLQVERAASREEAVQRVRDAASDLAVIVPADFSGKALEGREATWEMVPGRNRERSVTAQLLLGAFLEEINVNQAAALTFGAPADPALRSGTDAASQALESVRVGSLGSDGAAYTATQYYAASMLVMFLLYSGMSAAISLAAEKEKHTLQRLKSLPVRGVSVLLGKIAGNSLIALLQAAIIIGATKLLYGVDWGESYGLLLLVCGLIIIVSMGLAVLGMLAAGSTKAIASVFQVLIVTMTFLSGGFMPLPAGWISRLGEWTVNHWGMQSMLRMMLGSDSAVIFHHIAMLSWIACGTLLAALVAYRKVGYRE